MSYRILCQNPAHKEKTPSCVIFPDGYKCYGCGAYGPLTDLKGEFTVPTRRPPENLEETLSYIKELDTVSIRGLTLPADHEAYYIVWPSGEYYKKRRYIGNNGDKYMCPVGHPKPLYVPHDPKGSTILAIVEGELNALSLSTINPPYAVCSPGGAAQFFGKNYDFDKQYYLTKKVFYIIVDKDTSGLDGAIKLKGKLLQDGAGPRIEIVLMDIDCNDLLVSGELKKQAERWHPGGG